MITNRGWYLRLLEPFTEIKEIDLSFKEGDPDREMKSQFNHTCNIIRRTPIVSLNIASIVSLPLLEKIIQFVQDLSKS